MLAAALLPSPQIIHTGHTQQSTTLDTWRAPPTPDPLTLRLRSGPVRVCDAKEHLYCDGDPATHVYRVEIGHLCLYKMMSDGRRHVLGFAYPGDIVGLGAMGEHMGNAVAITRTVLRSLPRQSLHQSIAGDPQLGRQVYEALVRELEASRDMVFTVGQRTAVERVAAFLLAISRRNARHHEDPDEFVLPMGRSDIADFLGLTIETVSRVFTKLRTAGIIELTQSVLVTIQNPAALAALGEGSRP